MTGYALWSVAGVGLVTALLCLAKLLALRIVLRGSTPDQRAPLVRAVADLFRHRR